LYQTLALMHETVTVRFDWSAVKGKGKR